MANLKVLDGDENPKYLAMDGAGTNGDPHIPAGSSDMQSDIASMQSDIASMKTTLESILSILEG